MSQLEEVNPRKMKHEEKLAFWINIHNALVMHVIMTLSSLMLLRTSTNFLLFILFFFFFSTGIFSLWDSTEQCKKSFSALEGKIIIKMKGKKTYNCFLFQSYKRKGYVCSYSSCMVQAGYNIGGHTISADTIQSFILGCRMSRPGQVSRYQLSLGLLNFQIFKNMM